jgi:hypothetical protein
MFDFLGLIFCILMLLLIVIFAAWLYKICFCCKHSWNIENRENIISFYSRKLVGYKYTYICINCLSIKNKKVMF